MDIKLIIEEHAHSFLQSVKTEYQSNKEARKIIQKYLKEGSITEEEDTILKTQFMDSLKIVGIGVPFVLIPGASILMPVLIKVAKKHNIDLLPSAFGNSTHP